MNARYFLGKRIARVAYCGCAMAGFFILAAATAQADRMMGKEDLRESMRNSRGNSILKTGEAAPVFRVMTVDGREIDMAKLRGKVVYINLFTTWCGWCHWQEPHMRKMVWPRFKDRENFVMVAIAREEDAQTVRRYVQSVDLPYPAAPDPDRRIFSKFAKGNVARHFVVDAQGKIVYQSGDLAEETLEECEVDRAGMISYDEFLQKRFNKINAIIEGELGKIEEMNVAAK